MAIRNGRIAEVGRHAEVMDFAFSHQAHTRKQTRQVKKSMKKSPERNSAFRRWIAFGSGSLFLLFLSLSEPHRVHHLFESFGHPRNETQVDSDNRDHGRDQTKPTQANCALQSVAQNCHLGQVELVDLPFVESHLESFDPQTNRWVDLFTSFPFLQRAPPKDTLLS